MEHLEHVMEKKMFVVDVLVLLVLLVETLRKLTVTLLRRSVR